MSAKIERLYHIRRVDNRLFRKTPYKKVLKSLGSRTVLLRPIVGSPSKSRVKTRKTALPALSPAIPIVDINLKKILNDGELYGHIFLGDYESASDFSLLKERNIYGILVLGKSDEELYKFPSIKGGYKHMLKNELRDGLLFGIRDIQLFFERLLLEGHVLVVHTQSRVISHAVVIAFIMASYRQTFEQASGLMSDFELTLTPETEETLKRLDFFLTKNI